MELQSIASNLLHKMQRQGLSVLSDAELVGLLLASAQLDTSLLTRIEQLLAHRGGLKGLLRMSQQTLKQHLHVPLLIGYRLHVASELSRRLRWAALQRAHTLTSPHVLGPFC